MGPDVRTGDVSRAHWETIRPPCPGCGHKKIYGTWQGHARGCSIERRCEEQRRADDAWFMRHPDRSERVRETTTAEALAEFWLDGTVAGRYTHITDVTRLRSSGGKVSVVGFVHTSDSP